MKFSFAILMGLVGAASSATAANVFYTIDFTTTSGIGPTAGSFTYDAATTTILNFIVTGNGIDFDLTFNANPPSVSGACDVGPLGGTALDTYSSLFGTHCGAVVVAHTWSAFSTLP